MWILKNYKYLLECILSSPVSSCNSVKIFDFNLYPTIPHSNLKDRLKELVELCIIKKEWPTWYKYLVLQRGQINLILLKNKKQNKTKKPQQKPTLILDTKNYLKLISSKCSSFFYWQYIWYVWWTCFPIDSRYTYVYKLCSSYHRLIPIFVRDSLHTWASQEKPRETCLFL